MSAQSPEILGTRRLALAIAILLGHQFPVIAQAPPVPAVPAASPAPAPDAPATREAMLEDRLRRLEETNQRILQRYEAMEKEHAERYKKLSQDFKALQERVQAGSAPTVGAVGTTGVAPSPDASTDAGEMGVTAGGPDEGPEGTLGRGASSEEDMNTGTSGAATASTGGTGPKLYGPAGRIGRGSAGKGGTGESKVRPVKVTIANGLRFDSDDGEFAMQFHDLTQAELRNFPGMGDQSPLKTQFFIPRQRWYFVGRATKNVEFYTVINRGYGSLDLLDAFLNFNFDPRIQFRAGRFKTPTSYEYYMIAEGDLIAPERSLFIGNLSGNRQDGFMFHGQLLEQSAEWALGVFNGPRRSFGDFNNDKDLYSFFNIRPFQNTDLFPALKIMNFGGAYNFGTENNPLQPSIFTTANDETGASNNAVIKSLSPTFLAFNNNVVENGYRAEWAAWIAWYYKSFNVLAEYDGGFQDYSLSNSTYRTRLPYEGFQTTVYYFLTGEQITRRVDVKPNKNFAVKNKRITGPGAVEIFGRYSVLNIGHNVFTAGLADPNLWTDHAYAIDTGINWYLNEYTKIYMDWQHSVFGNPVTNGVHSFVRTPNLLWLRFQLFF
jgi:phosphate-selective porin OprO/OprP